MSLPCFIVRDLIPLYTEKLLSPESDEALRQHLAHCPACKKAVESMDVPVPVPEVPFAPVKVLKKELRRRRRLTVLLAVSVLLVFVISFFAHLTSPQYIPYAQSGIEVYTDGSGKLFADLPAQATEYRLSDFSGPSDNGQVYLSIEMWHTRLSSRGEPRTILLAQDSGQYQGVFYTDNTQGGTNYLLWGTAHEGSQLLPRLVLSYYAFLAALSAGILGIVCIILRKRNSFRLWVKLLFVPLSWLGGQFFTFGFQTTHYYVLRPLILIALASLFLYLAFLSLWSMRSPGIPEDGGA